MDFHRWILVMAFACGASCLVQLGDRETSFLNNRPQRCSYQTAYRMLGAYCSGLNLHVVPSTLKSSIEILDASFNRIRDLRNSTFQSYSSLRFLYLGDNMIQNIEPMAFLPLTSLEVLDLSLNALTTVPAPILNLPSLRKLFFSDNALTNIHADLENTEKPIRAPLKFLNLAYCHLTKMPDFGILTDLEHLNVSGNQFAELRPRDFSQMCSIKSIDLNSSYVARDVCEIQNLIIWFEEHSIQAIPLTHGWSDNSTAGLFFSSKCPNIGFDEDTIKSHSECKTTVETKQLSKSVTKTWMIIAISLGAVILAVMMLLYTLHRRNVRRTRETKKKLMMKANNEETTKPVLALLSDT